MFVGLPIDNNMEYVLALTNSHIRYGIGLIFAFFANKHINGVNVSITISFDVYLSKFG